MSGRMLTSAGSASSLRRQCQNRALARVPCSVFEMTSPADGRGRAFERGAPGRKKRRTEWSARKMLCEV